MSIRGGIYMLKLKGVLPWGRSARAHQYQQPQQEGNCKEIYKKNLIFKAHL